MTRCRLAIGLVVSACFIWPVAALAEEETPVGKPVAMPIVPAPADCVVAPRTVEELRELIGTPEPFVPPPPDATPPPQPTPAPRPTTPPSEPAEPATIAAISATVYHFLACVNAGDMLRGYALYTDEFVRTSVFFDPAMERPPVPVPPDQRVTLLDITYVRVYPDDRVGAVIVIDDPLAPSPAEPYFFVFREVDGDWLFDEWPVTTFLAGVDVDEGNAEVAPTVAPVDPYLSN
jgi:hypothetical protein